MDRKTIPASLFSLLLLVALVPFGLTGCGGSEERDEAALIEATESAVEDSSAGTSAESPTDSASFPELQPTPRWESERLTAPRYVPARPVETVVARTSMGELTIKDLIDVYTHWQLPVQPPTVPEKIPEMPDPWLDGLAREVAMARAAEREANLVSVPELVAKYFQANQELRVLIALQEIVKREVLDKMTVPTDEEVAQYYEDHKPEYYQPFQFSMRYIIRSTYEPYTVRQGDSLESIAETICGDAAQVSRIRSAVDTQPLRWVPPEERARRLFRPLDVGEKLLVPMHPDKMDAVRKELETILAELDRGAAFEQLAKDNAEPPYRGEVIPSLPSGVRKMVPEIIEAIRNTPAGEVSGIFHTKHGFMALEVIEVVDEGFRPIEEVKRSIIDEMTKDQEARYDKELADGLFSGPDFKINYDVIARAPDVEDDETVIVVGAVEIPWAAFRVAWDSLIGKPGASRETIDQAVRSSSAARMALYEFWAVENGVYDDPEIGYVARRTQTIARAHMQALGQAAARRAVTEEAIQKLYEAQTERFASRPILAYQTIELRPDDSALSGGELDRELDRLKDRLITILEPVTTIDDFVGLAKRINSGVSTMGTPLQTRGVDPDLLSGPTADRIEKLEPGEWSKPYVESGAVRVVAVTQFTPAGIRPLVEARAEVIDQLAEKALKDVRESLGRQYLQRIEYEFVLGEEQ